MIEGIVREAIGVWAVTSTHPKSEACGIRLIEELENPENDLNAPIHGKEELPFFSWISHSHNNSNVDIAWLKEESKHIIDSLLHVFGEFGGAYREAKKLYDLIVFGLEGKDLIAAYAEEMFATFDLSTEPVLQSTIGHMLSKQQGPLMNITLVAGIQAFDCIEKVLGATVAEKTVRSEPLKYTPKNIKEAFIQETSQIIKKAFIDAVSTPLYAKYRAFEKTLFNLWINTPESKLEATEKHDV